SDDKVVFVVSQLREVRLVLRVIVRVQNDSLERTILLRRTEAANHSGVQAPIAETSAISHESDAQTTLSGWCRGTSREYHCDEHPTEPTREHAGKYPLAPKSRSVARRPDSPTPSACERRALRSSRR